VRRTYLATSLANTAAARALAATLRAAGVPVVSRWVDWPELADAACPPVELRRRMDANAADVQLAEALLYLPHPAARGALFEAGWAYGAGKAVAVLGAPADVTPMLAQPGVAFLASEAAALAWATRGAR
jgi:hypothetical protein